MNGLLVSRGVDGALLALLLLGHSLGDFVFQDRRMVQRKTEVSWLVRHGLVILLVQGICLLPFASFRIVPVLVGLALLHVLIDRGKTALGNPTSLALFLGDQAAHCTVLLLAWQALRALGAGPVFDLEGIQAGRLATVAVVVSAYAWNGSGGAAVVALLLHRFRLEEVREEVAERAARGRMIGILERMLLLTMVLANQWGALGLILAAKSIARFKDLDHREFSEYFLIGTLTSVLFAVASGLLVRLLI